MPPKSTTDQLVNPELALLGALTERFPNVAAARAEIAALRAGLLLPKPVVHVISDIHGDYKKLRHVLNNASGSLRPLVESLFSGRMSPEALVRFLSIVYYPYETMERLRATLKTADEQASWACETLRAQFELVRSLAPRYRRARLLAAFPADLRELFQEL